MSNGTVGLSGASIFLDEEVFLTEGRDGREEVKIGDLAAEPARISECANEFFNEQTR